MRQRVCHYQNIVDTQIESKETSLFLHQLIAVTRKRFFKIENLFVYQKIKDLEHQKSGHFHPKKAGKGMVMTTVAKQLSMCHGKLLLSVLAL